MKSANALLYLSPQYENYQSQTLVAQPIHEEEEYAMQIPGASPVNNENNRSQGGGFAMDDNISFRGHSEFQDDTTSR